MTFNILPNTFDVSKEKAICQNTASPASLKAVAEWDWKQPGQRGKQLGFCVRQPPHAIGVADAEKMVFITLFLPVVIVVSILLRHLILRESRIPKPTAAPGSQNPQKHPVSTNMRNVVSANVGLFPAVIWIQIRPKKHLFHPL